MISLADLGGLENAKLDAVDHFIIEAENNYSDEARCIRFRLNNVTYIAQEDPADHHDSSMKRIFIQDEPQNLRVFEPALVHTIHASRRNQLLNARGSKDLAKCDVLQIIDASSGALILEVGTDQINDSFQTFVGRYTLGAITYHSWHTYEQVLEEERRAVDTNYSNTLEYGAF